MCAILEPFSLGIPAEAALRPFLGCPPPLECRAEAISCGAHMSGTAENGMRGNRAG
jgi:hypothetical protein